MAKILGSEYVHLKDNFSYCYFLLIAQKKGLGLNI